MKKVVAIAGVVVLLTLGGCGPRPVTRAWTEDALLDDGSTVRIERTVTFLETNSLSGDSYNAAEMDATIAFTGDRAHLPTLRHGLMALLLYRDQTTDEWVVVATTTTCRVWQLRGQPSPNYWEFRLRDQEWQETPLSEASFGRSVNLLHRYQKELNARHITVTDRRRLESDPGINRRFKAIVPDADSNCPPAINIPATKTPAINVDRDNNGPRRGRMVSDTGLRVVAYDVYSESDESKYH